MDIQTVTLIALGISTLVILAFFSVFRYRGKFSIKTKLGEVAAEGENAPPANIGNSKPQFLDKSQKSGFESAGIKQIGTGSSVIVAQSGANVTVQTGERPYHSKTDESQLVGNNKIDDSNGQIAKATSEPVTIHVTIENKFDNECDTPPPITGWIGRSGELLLMARSGIKVIAITGIGGQGKSTLAAKFLTDGENDAFFRDWRDCKEENNTLHTQIVRIIQRITNGKTRASEISTESTASVIKLFLHHAASVDGIFVFDNVDQYVDVEHSRVVGAMHLLIEGALKTRGNARFVFTCRPRLVYESSAFLQIELHGLSSEETRRLFQARGVNVDVKYVDEVHELTQGHPLWLNLIATQILTNKVEIREFIARIKSGREAGLPNVTLQEIWRTLKPKHQKFLRYLAEIVYPETASHVEQYVSRELNANQFIKCFRQLRSLDLIVVKSPANGPETMELHPVVREFVRRQFSISERSYYISAIVLSLDRDILKYKAALVAEVSYYVLQIWIAKAELLINSREYSKALDVLDESQKPLLRNGFAEEFVRLSSLLFDSYEWNEALTLDGARYDNVYKDFVDVLVQLGRFDDAERYIKKFEDTVSGATARLVAVCDMRAYLYWNQEKFNLAKDWGKRGVDIKLKSQLDTRHDCSHNLALARRDSGEIDKALATFLGATSLDVVLNPKEIFPAKGGAFYGNIGRSLFFKGDYEASLLCLIKSATLLEKEKHEIILINQGWAAFWLAEFFEKRQDSKMAFICYKRAGIKWKLVSPPRADKANEALERLSKIDKQLLELQDWQLEHAYVEWLGKAGTFTQVK